MAERNQYKVETPNGKVERHTNRAKADRRARELSRTVSGIHFLAILKHDSPESHPQGRWDVIQRYSNGAVTLYR